MKLAIWMDQNFSRHVTGAPTGSPLNYRDPSSQYVIPSIGQKINMIRGYIATNSGY